MKIILLFLLLLMSSCAKLSYIVSQAEGQISLLNRARANSEVLKDVRVSSVDKDKIRRIERYKSFFTDYFSVKPNRHYTKTTFLQSKAVSYLVIHSPKNKIEAQQSCFPFVGCFPYLGFFSEEDAKKFLQKKNKEGFSTYMRDVYAYSTLGHFSDPILSSFFYYDDFELSELIFHELFHTYFFVKDEVDFNENLATFFAIELQKEFYQRSDKLQKRLKEEKRKRELHQYIAQLTRELQKLYVHGDKPQQVLKSFIEQRFTPAVQKKCDELQFPTCYPLKGKWNNARFAAFLTYQAKGEKLDNFYKNSKLSLKAFFFLLKQRYDKFLQQSERGSFESYLFN